MSFDLPTMAQRAGIRRALTFRPINPTNAQAQSLAQLYLAVVAVWNDPDRILARYTPNLTLDSPADNAAAIDEADSEAKRLIVDFGASVRRWAMRIELWHRGKWSASIRASTGLDVGMVLTSSPVQETIDQFVERNVALVRDVTDQARGKIADAVFRGYQQKLPAREVANDIREATSFARDRSLRIASHQNANLSAALDRERRAEAGIELFRWRHSGKLHGRPHHKARDGHIYDSATGKRVEPDGSKMDGGETIPATDRAGVPPFCGCREQAYLPIMAEIGV